MSMADRWHSALDCPSVRDTAMLAEVLRTLQGQLEGDGGATEASAADVEDLVSHAVAELQRLNAAQPNLGGIAPVLGAGVLQQLLRQRREGLPAATPVPNKVDERR